MQDLAVEDLQILVSSVPIYKKMKWRIQII
jgi:hypothetical protein